MVLPRGAVGWAAVFDCGISWSFTLWDLHVIAMFYSYLRLAYIILAHKSVRKISAPTPTKFQIS